MSAARLTLQLLLTQIGPLLKHLQRTAFQPRSMHRRLSASKTFRCNRMIKQFCLPRSSTTASHCVGPCWLRPSGALGVCLKELRRLKRRRRRALFARHNTALGGQVQRADRTMKTADFELQCCTWRGGVSCSLPPPPPPPRLCCCACAAEDDLSSHQPPTKFHFSG